MVLPWQKWPLSGKQQKGQGARQSGTLSRPEATQCCGKAKCHVSPVLVMQSLSPAVRWTPGDKTHTRVQKTLRDVPWIDEHCKCHNKYSARERKRRRRVRNNRQRNRRQRLQTHTQRTQNGERINSFRLLGGTGINYFADSRFLQSFQLLSVTLSNVKDELLPSGIKRSIS